jgi:hypothetical protein
MGEGLMDNTIKTYPYSFCERCLILSPVRVMDLVGINECRVCSEIMSQKTNRVVWLSREEAHVRGLRLYRERKKKSDKNE